MYIFKETERAKVLQGRTIKYLAENKLFVSYPYLVDVLKGKRACSSLLAHSITNCISFSAKVEDDVIRKEI